MHASPVRSSSAPEIRPRSPRFDFDDVPRRWFGGSLLGSHMVNGVNLLFPAGERFFVRSVRHYMDRIDDPELKEQIRGFFGQEGRHANAHEKYFETLEKQGFRFRSFLAFYEWFTFHVLERLAPPALRLSTTAACEHFTATMAKNALEDDIFAPAHPAMRALLMWHSVEEVEHKSVAFDVLREIDPSYALRVAGLALSGALLGGFWIAATAMFLRQDGASLRQLRDELKALGDRNPFGERVYGAAIRSYLRRTFHPSDETRDGELARAYVEEAGLA